MPPTFCPTAPSEGEGAAEFGPRAQEEGRMSARGKGVSQEMGTMQQGWTADGTEKQVPPASSPLGPFLFQWLPDA